MKDINTRLDELEFDIETELQLFADETGMCPYAVKVYWRRDANEGFYPDCEILISNEFRNTPKPRNN